MNEWKQKLKMRLPVILLLAATLAFWGFYDSYESAGPVLLESLTLSDAVRVRGNCTETNGHFVLSVKEGEKGAEARFRIPDSTSHGHIRLRGRMKATDVVPGPHDWTCARLMLIMYGADNKWIPGPHSMLLESGTTGWDYREQVFEMHPDTHHADVVIQQIGKSGSAEFDRIEACPVRPRKSYALWRMLFAGFWLAAAVVYFRRCRLHERKLRWLILLNVIAILVGTLLPGKWIDSGKREVEGMVGKVLEGKEVSQPVEPGAKPVRDSKHMEQVDALLTNSHKSGHFVLFASLCFLVYLSAALERQHVSYFFKVAFDILIFAAITESLQQLTLDRAAGFGDLWLDVCGMFLAFIVFLCILPLVRRRLRGN